MSEMHAIALAVDGSTSSHRALEWAIDLAKLHAGSLTIVSVLAVQRLYSAGGGVTTTTRADDRRYGHELLERYAEIARHAGVTTVSTTLLEGTVVDQLLGFLDDRRPDLIVLGARGLSPSRRLLLGSVSDALVHHAHCAVLVIPPPHSAKPAPPHRPAAERAAVGGRRRR